MYDKKINISSTAVEQGLDIAKSFINKLVSPSIEELGLLMKDQISYWRFNNQVKILNKAKSVCEKNSINVKAISPKILCPYLEKASLEDDDDLQNKWANLLVNMVDSEQNIENHVFPYILSQLSKDEFYLLESVFNEKYERKSILQEELDLLVSDRPRVEKELKLKLDEIERKIKDKDTDKELKFSAELSRLKASRLSVIHQIRLLNYREPELKREISLPQSIPEENIKKFELANIIRLGLAKVIYYANAGPQSIDVPNGMPDSHEYTSVDFDVEIETETDTVLTELGELFIEACHSKHA